MISRIDIEDMTDAQDEAPERIWADRSPFGEHSWMDVEYDGGTLYVRSDLARPSQAGDERVARPDAVSLLATAQGIVAAMRADQSPGPVFKALNEVIGVLEELRRAALAAMDTPKGGGDE